MNQWNEDLVLINQGFETDAFGNQIARDTRTVVQASQINIGMNEFYAAAQSGIRPELEFVIHIFEYSGEQIFEFNGTRYTLIRLYKRNDDELEVYLERKAAVNDKK